MKVYRKKEKASVHLIIFFDEKLDNVLFGIIIEILFRIVNRIVKCSNFTVFWIEELDDMIKIVVTLKMVVVKKSLHLQRRRKSFESAHM